MKRSFLAIMLSCLCLVSVGCDCVSFDSLIKARLANYHVSRWVFTAETLEIGERGQYSMQVLEVFKGFDVPNIVLGEPHDNCSMEPNVVGEIWLIYTSGDSAGKIDLNSCSLARDMRNKHIPISIYGLFNFDKPLMQRTSEKQQNRSRQELFQKAKEALVNDVNWLREKRPIWRSKHPLEDITGSYPDYGLSEL